MKRFTSKTQKIGEYGENICCKWLEKNGFTIKERNYTVREGEIDIVAHKNNKLHFIEVKSVSCRNRNNVPRETHYNPAQNVTKQKIRKCQIAILSYIEKNSVSHETQLDVYVVYIDNRNVKHKIERIENVF